MAPMYYNPVPQDIVSEKYNDQSREGGLTPLKTQDNLESQTPHQRSSRRTRFRRIFHLVASILLLLSLFVMVRNRQEILDWRNDASSIPYMNLKQSWTSNDIKDFTFIQSLNHDHDVSSGESIQIRGGVVVKSAPPESSAVSIDLKVEISHEELKDYIFINDSANGFEFKTADVVPYESGISRPWIKVDATIFVSPDFEGSKFNVDTVQLPVELHETLKLATQRLSVKTVSGAISSKTETMDSRIVELETTSNSISGSYPLADILSAKSISGTITLNISPQPADSTNLDPELTVETKSGSIRIDTILTHLPDRKYHTFISTTSGTIDGTYLNGETTRIIGGSGSIDIELDNAGSVHSRDLSISSMSGTINAVLGDRLYDTHELNSHVKSMSGSVDLAFPETWSGSFELESMSGSLRATGRDVRITKRDGFVKKTLEGVRGNGASDVVVSTMSGGVDVEFK